MAKIKIEVREPFVGTRIPHGRDCVVYVVDDDGSKTKLDGVRDVSWRCHARSGPVTATIVVYAEPPEGIVSAEIVDVSELLDRLETLEKKNVSLADENQRLRAVLADSETSCPRME